MQRWGLYVLDAGTAQTAPGEIYPVQDHPESYYFDWETGRTLNEYQLVYITEGRGHFQSSHTDLLEVSAGDALLLFPGEWHRYRPDPEVGWSEYWIGFRGTNTQYMVQSSFLKTRPVIRVLHNLELLNTFQSIQYWLRDESPGYRRILASLAQLALAVVYRDALNSEDSSRMHSREIELAKIELTRRHPEHVDLTELAGRLGLSYSNFRVLFKQNTGLSPRQYHLQAKLNRASELLLHSRYNISEIADQLGFSSVFYFSRFFKAKQGISPDSFRRQNQLPA